MQILFDNLGTNRALFTFTDVPNILSLKEPNNTGGVASVTLTFQGILYGQTSPDGYWYITLDDNTIIGVNNYQDAVNRNFLVSNSNQSTAASVARALRNCPTVAANYLVQHQGQQVIVTAREGGLWYPNLKTNIPTQYLDKTIRNGSDKTVPDGTIINVDVFANGAYKTTLEKNFYNGECNFNMSPVLTTFAEYGKTVPYYFRISQITRGQYNLLTTTEDSYITPGYMVNQGQPFLQVTNNVQLAQNVKRGTPKAVSNNSILYVYNPSITISFYQNTPGSQFIDVIYRNSALQEIHSADVTFTSSDSSKLKTHTINLNESWLRDSFYVDVYFEQTGETIRYNVIKPLKATEYCQRVYFRNSYGGTSFFDFTGQRQEEKTFTTMTYNTSIFDYYDEYSKHTLEKIYDRDVTYTVSLKSHLIEKDGTYIFNDMIQSTDVWTVINGETYSIIIDSLDVQETQNNDIFEATIKYHYSQTPSLI